MNETPKEVAGDKKLVNNFNKKFTNYRCAECAMDIITRLEAEFKTLDDENPITLNIEDFVLALQRLGIEAFGADTIAGYEGNDHFNTSQFRHRFTIRSKVNGKWKCVMLVNAYGVWTNGGKMVIFEIEEDKD